MLRRLALAFTSCASSRTIADAAAVRCMLEYTALLPSRTPAGAQAAPVQQGAWGATGGLASSTAAERHCGTPPVQPALWSANGALS